MRVRLRGGFYKVLAVYTHSEPLKRRFGASKLWLAAGEYPCHKRGAQRWIGLKDPEAEGELNYFRLERLQTEAKPCRCGRLKFPHKRSKACEDY